ncbi:AbfB domain-containing protein [Metabacillus sp. Hm71]|uniref:AbfB domain-containing protein n=1 Tax=Metabacillus sp. Hm71 TaxID=3450743 RepID=UPI003F42F5BD
MNANAFRHYPYFGYSPFINPYHYSGLNTAHPYVYLNSIRSGSYPYKVPTQMYPYTIPTETYPYIAPTEMNPYFVQREYDPITGTYEDVRVIAGILAVAGAAGQVAGAINAVSGALGTINAPRSVILTITNHTNTTLRKVREKLDHGGWAATPTAEIPPGQTLVFGATSSAWSIATGTEGRITYAGEGIEMTAYWNNPFIGNNSCNITVTGPNANQYNGTRVCGAGNTNAQMRYELTRIPATRISLESVNYPNRFIRHQNYLGELTPIQSELDRRDATFDWTGDWRYGAEGQLRSINFPTHYLRHQNFRLKLHTIYDAPDWNLRYLDSTFTMVPGLADPTNPELVSFRSKNFPDRFIRHRNFNLWVESVNDDLGRKDATFRRRGPFIQ